MKTRHVVAGALLAVAIAAFGATPAPPAVRVEGAWIRWLPANLPQAGYVVIMNDGNVALQIVGASSPAYRTVMLHRSRLAHADSTMEMVPAVEIPPHDVLRLAPGGYHLMLSRPTHPVEPGDEVPITLQFAGGASLRVNFQVLPANVAGPR